jgi:PAS domain S-box-containing protein
MDHGPTIAWMKDSEGRLVYVSETFKSMFKLHGDCYGMTSDDILPPELAKQHRENDQTVLDTNRPIQVIEDAVGPGGRSTSWLVTKFPFSTANGVRFVGGIGVDITERKRAQDALQESDARFRLFMDNSPVSAWMKNAEGRYVYLNKAYERSHKLRLVDCFNKTDAEIFSPELAKQFRDHDIKTLAADCSLQVVEDALDDSKWLVTKFPVPTAGGERHIAGVGIDITEREKMEEVWRHMSAIVNSSYDAIIGKTLDGIITSWNPGAERLYGYTASEVMGMPIRMLLPPGYPDDISVILRKVANGEHTHDYETVRRRKDGTLLDVSLRVSPILDSSGKVVGAATITHDITRRKQAEEALLQSEKLAATGRLAASIAHEINNPLAGALNAIYLARMNSDNADEMLRVAERELRRASHITQQTLGFYRDRSGHQQVSIHELVQEVLSVYGTKLRNRNITVRYLHRCGCNSHKACPNECQECGKHLRINAGELRQIISNLLVNGIDALSNSGVMEIRVSRVAGKVQLTMADNGHGIRAEHLKRIFEPFFTTKKDTGTGLGLWVTQELVHKHGGEIKVRSRREKGTVFRITFPATPAA